MSITIKRRWDDATLYVAENAADVRAAVVEAVKNRADLRSADLRSADLRSADLSGAYLRSAYLSGAYLRSADLRSARGIHPERVNDLLILLDQPGKIRAYKLVTKDGYGPINGGLRYVVGETVEVPNANTDPAVQCAAGINVATLPWCLHEWKPGYRILVVEFTRKDIAAIPNGDGKFRLHRCKVMSERAIDPVAFGLVKVEEQAP